MNVFQPGNDVRTVLQEVVLTLNMQGETCQGSLTRVSQQVNQSGYVKGGVGGDFEMMVEETC